MYISKAVVNARIQFEDGDLALIHIPIDLYSVFVIPVLRVLELLGAPSPRADGSGNESWAFPYPFANLTFTPIEVSLMLPRPLIKQIFESTLAALSSSSLSRLLVTTEDYAALRVAGADMQAGQRVIDLSAPLAMAGISIFFITSYGSDFILVPKHALPDVITVLEKLGFTLRSRTEMSNAPTSSKRSVPDDRRHDRGPTKGSRKKNPSLPPASTADRAGVKDWQVRMFRQLKRHGVVPSLDPDLKLASTSVKRSELADYTQHVSAVLRQILVATRNPLPRFLSVTLSDTDTMSVAMDLTLLGKFGATPEELEKVLHISRDTSVPIMLDLRKVPHDRAVGIVCGTASRMLQRMDDEQRAEGAGGPRAKRREQGIGGGFSMGYVSTVRGGSVLVREDEVEDARGLVREMLDVDVGKYDEMDDDDDDFEFHFELELD